MNIRTLNPDTKFRSGDGRPVAVIKLTPDALAERYGIEFVHGADDSDYYQTAVIALPNGPITRLLRYAHDPDPGTAVYADIQLDVEQAQRTVSRLLGLTRDDFTWLAERAKTHEVEGGNTRIVKNAITEQQNIDVPVQREEASITERGVFTPDPLAARDQEIVVPLRAAEVVTSKQAVGTGEAGIRRETVTETQRVSDSVRRESVHVEDPNNPPIHTEGFTTEQRSRYEGMSEADRARYGRFTAVERTQYDAMTSQQRRIWTAEYDRRKPTDGISGAITGRDNTCR